MNARSRKLLLATAVAGVGVLGVGVAGAVTAGDNTPGPNPAGAEHANSQAWETLPSAVNTPTSNGPSSASHAAGAPGSGEAPSSDSLSTALIKTEGTPGNTVLQDLINTAPGADRGSAISGDAKNIAPAYTSLPEQAGAGTTHKP
jgi:hypothetical protein